FLEEAVEELAACYIGATMDPASFNNVVIVSASGGVDIETVAQERPEAIHRVEIQENEAELPNDLARELAEKLLGDLGTASTTAAELAGIIAKLYALYQSVDAKVCEINPLLITP
ncbi:MAG: succinate--CoA ligase subunit beta, partial [Thermoplasmata archaeon]|nr:succinate--CoA ligase subunit beta [Thermoplasmata archaeon]NIY04461.1 succinate--CoA ligase subunit beta [Thermoplasmata archaeon]